MHCQFDDPTDLLKLILIEKSGHVQIDSISAMRPLELEEFELHCIGKRTDHSMKIGFFCPNEGFAGNFGYLPLELENRGCEVLWLFGTIAGYLESSHKNKWLIINDMARRIYGIDAIVTASVMDCLPNGPLHVLHDHLSFAHFDLEGHIDRLLHSTGGENRAFLSLRELFNDLSAFVAFLPFYDLILTPSQAITDLTLKALYFSGYDSLPLLSGAPENKLKLDTISHLVDVKSYRDSITVFQSGYCKLDAPIRQYGNTPAENIIVFAPTPNDTTGNKENPLWTSVLAVNSHGVDLLRNLCQNLPDYKIIFKPYKDELPEVVENIRRKLSDCTNLEIDGCGSMYWDLYSRTKILISDFSSTAYTFALGIGRPVVFFSPNEDSLPEEVLNNTYCRNRCKIGLIAKTTNEVTKAISIILGDYHQFLSRASDFRQQNCVQPGYASAAGAAAIISAISERRKEQPLGNKGIRLKRS